MVPSAVLDVGSHEGFTVDRFLEDLPGQTIHAFEPTPASLEVLRRRMAGHPNVHVHPLALSNRNGTTEFFLNAEAATNSLLENAAGADRPFERLQRHVATVEVETARLDDWAPKHVPDGRLVVKADVQGVRPEWVLPL